MQSDPTARPKKGEVYRHPKVRGNWRVRSAGAKFVTLEPSLPQLPSKRIPTPGFMTANWERVR